MQMDCRVATLLAMTKERWMLVLQDVEPTNVSHHPARVIARTEAKKQSI